MISTTRRQSLCLLAASGLNMVLGKSVMASEGKLFLGSRQIDNRHEAVVFNAHGQQLCALPLQGRGHGGAMSCNAGHMVIFARRPDKFALVIDYKKARLATTLQTPDDRHFYGHGCFSPDGKLLYASENDFDKARGIISIWDVHNGYKRVAEFESFGIGPHELVMMPDGKTIAIANGGIETHPDSDRFKLNIPDMQPNLTLIDVRDGKKLKTLELPRELHKLSIRHLAVSASATLGIGLQYQGPGSDLPPLVFKYHNGKFNWLKVPQNIHQGMKNYCGSVAVDISGNILAVSAPRGSSINFWSLTDNRFLRSIKVEDGCGLAPSSVANGFVISSGKGRVIHYDPVSHQQRLLSQKVAAGWDNHIISG